MSRYMLIMRSTPEAEVAMQEANIDFSEVIESMGRFNEELIKAGVMLAGEGLTGPDEGFVVDFDADPPVVTDGPYTEAKELFNGFWILDVSSKEEAKQWAQKVPLGKGVKLEVRRVLRVGRISDRQSVDREGDPVAGRPGREDRRSGARGRRQAGALILAEIAYLARIRMGPRQSASGSSTSPFWEISTSPERASWRATSRASSIRSRQWSPPTCRAASDGQMVLAGPRSRARSRIAARSC